MGREYDPNDEGGDEEEEEEYKSGYCAKCVEIVAYLFCCPCCLVWDCCCAKEDRHESEKKTWKLDRGEDHGHVVRADGLDGGRKGAAPEKPGPTGPVCVACCVQEEGDSM